MQNEENKLISYACEQFERGGGYDKALEAFILAYQKGYQQSWILETIYNCYMSGNDNEFQNAYLNQAQNEKIAYNECLLDFIPYKDGEYFIFDKEKRAFLGVFSIPVLQGIKQDAIFDEMEYSAAALALDWDLREESDILTIAQQRKIYIVCKDAKRCMSFWKIPELKKYLKNIMVFFDFNEIQDYFHKNTAVHLPMIIRGGEKEGKILAKIREEEHRYRLTPEGRNTQNVLLTIAIPTANRGNLLLKRLENLLYMPYDAEIEIAVSKNCSQKYEEEYKQAGNIKDARLHYYDHGKDLIGHQNFHYVIKMSCGKYVMLVSDEDDVILGSIEHYLKILSSNPELSVVRVKSKNYSQLVERRYAKKGIGAFELMFTAQNYISGLILRRKDFNKDDFLKDPETLTDNIFFLYYPHECWSAILSYRGDALRDPVPFISEGESAHGKNFFPGYAAYNARLEQLGGMIDFLRLVVKGDIEGAQIGLWKIMYKIGLLLKIARELEHNSDNYVESVNQYIWICMEAIESFPFNGIQKVQLLNLLNYYGRDAIDYDSKMKERDIMLNKGSEDDI